MAAKTNAIRLAEHAGILKSDKYYEYDENDLNGCHAADAMGIPYEQVYKTLLTKGERTGMHVFCIPVCCELDLKKAAKAAGDKSIQMVKVKDLLALTGYIRGGCSPLGMKKHFPTHFEESCLLFDEIAVSAGERGHQMIVSTEGLLQLTDASCDDLII